MSMIQSDTMSELASIVAPLPAPPEGEVLTSEQWTVLLSVCEVFVPALSTSPGHANTQLNISKDELASIKASLSLHLPESANDGLLEAYLAESAVADPAFKASIHRKFGHYVPASDCQGLVFMLSSLNSSLGSMILTGYSTLLHKQPLAVRTQIVKGWATSSLPPLRALHRSISGLVKQTWLALSPTLPQMIGFPKVPKHVKRDNSFDFQFMQFEESSTAAEISTDIVIVGSGCGAGVCASNLAAAGHKVLVVEKSYHFPSSHFPMTTDSSGIQLMENGGAIVSDDASIVVLAGSTWGGGGTINWSASLQPQHFVREEWSKEGLPFFTSAEFQDCLDTVCGNMGVARSTDHAALEKVPQNFANKTLIEGSRKLGMAVETVPQNTGGKEHLCGYCGEGCSSATKQGPANRWLPDAAKNGAQFIEGCWIEKVVFETGKDALQTATGVKGKWTSKDRKTTRDIVIKAKKVIVSSGTLQSPLLLMRSGIKNPNVGRGLHLHPVSALAAVWPHEVRPWEGAILTSAMTALENLDGLHHGPKLEIIASTPGYLLPFVPWKPKLSNPALDFKTQAAKFHRMAGFISIQRDRDTGRVYPDPADPKRVRIAYTASERDRAGILEGQVAAARIAYTMGASEILNLHPESEDFVRKSDGTDDQVFDAWIAAMKKRGIKVPEPSMLGSAHQMGTNRMSSDARTGVVDSNGRVWGTQGLYVADASVFPSASGVNPMVTTMGISEWISRGIIRTLAKEKEGGEK